MNGDISCKAARFHVNEPAMKGFSLSLGGEGGVRGGGKNAELEALGDEPPNLFGDSGVS